MSFNEVPQEDIDIGELREDKKGQKSSAFEKFPRNREDFSLSSDQNKSSVSESQNKNDA